MFLKLNGKKVLNSCYFGWPCRESFFCPRLHAHETNGSTQWKRTHLPLYASKPLMTVITALVHPVFNMKVTNKRFSHGCELHSWCLARELIKKHEPACRYEDVYQSVMRCYKVDQNAHKSGFPNVFISFQHNDVIFLVLTDWSKSFTETVEALYLSVILYLLFLCILLFSAFLVFLRYMRPESKKKVIHNNNDNNNLIFILRKVHVIYDQMRITWN